MIINDIDTAARDIARAYRLTATNSNRAQRLHCIETYFDGGDPLTYPSRMTILRILTRIEQLID